MASPINPVENPNQGIVDGRPAGAPVEPAQVTLDTYVDPDASTDSPINPTESAVHGATSAQVHDSAGRPGGGMSSQELHHNGLPGRKRDTQGVDQWGPPGTRNIELDRANRMSRQDHREGRPEEE